MVVPRVVILSPMATPNAVKAPTTAIATKAAATAYSDNSRPVSSSKNFFIFVSSLEGLEKEAASALYLTPSLS